MNEKEFLEKCIDLSVFKRVKVKDGILSYMDKNSKLFEMPLSFDIDVFKQTNSDFLFDEKKNTLFISKKRTSRDFLKVPMFLEPDEEMVMKHINLSKEKSIKVKNNEVYYYTKNNKLNRFPLNFSIKYIDNSIRFLVIPGPDSYTIKKNPNFVIPSYDFDFYFKEFLNGKRLSNMFDYPEDSLINNELDIELIKKGMKFTDLALKNIKSINLISLLNKDTLNLDDDTEEIRIIEIEIEKEKEFPIEFFDRFNSINNFHTMYVLKCNDLKNYILPIKIKLKDTNKTIRVFQSGWILGDLNYNILDFGNEDFDISINNIYKNMIRFFSGIDFTNNESIEAYIQRILKKKTKEEIKDNVAYSGYLNKGVASFKELLLSYTFAISNNSSDEELNEQFTYIKRLCLIKLGLFSCRMKRMNSIFYSGYMWMAEKVI